MRLAGRKAPEQRCVPSAALPDQFSALFKPGACLIDVPTVDGRNDVHEPKRQILLGKMACFEVIQHMTQKCVHVVVVAVGKLGTFRHRSRFHFKSAEIE